MPRYKLGEIYGELRLKTKNWQENLGKSGRLTKATTQEMKRAFMATTIAVVGVGMAIGKVLKDTIRYGVETDKFAKQSGMLVEEVQKLRYAFDQEHASFETLTKAYPILTKYMAEARDGMATYKDEFDKMDISVVDAQGNLKTTNEVFFEMSDWMSKEGIPDTEKLAVATNLLGRRGAELIPVLKKGREWFEKMGDEAQKLGLVLDKEMIRTLKETDDAMTKMQGSMQGFRMILATQTIPALNVAIRQWTEWMVVINKVSQEIMGMAEKEELAGVLERTSETVLKMNARLREQRTELKELKEQGITSGATYEYLERTIKLTTDKIQELTGNAKTLYTEGLNPVDYSVKDLTSSFEGKTSAIKDQNAEEEKMIRNAKEATMSFTPFRENVEGWTEAVMYGAEKEKIFTDNTIDLTLRQKDAKKSTRDLTQTFQIFGSVMDKVFEKGKFTIEDFAKILINLSAMMVGGGIPGFGFLKGLTGFDKGGAMLPRGVKPYFMQEGGATLVKKPTEMTPMGNIAHRGEFVMTPAQVNALVNRPIIIKMFNTNPDTYAERVMESSMGIQQKFGRFMTKVMDERERLKGNL